MIILHLYSRYCQQKYSFDNNNLKYTEDILILSKRNELYIFCCFVFLHVDQFKRAKKGRAGLHSFSGITAKKTTTNYHKGKKKQVVIKRHQGNQGCGRMSARNNYKLSSKKPKFENHGTSKIHHHKNKIRTSTMSKQNKKRSKKETMGTKN